jgi:protein TonB
MTSQQILQANLLDIVFEKRNKLYGAYQLRKEYPQQLGKAVLFTLSAVLLLMLLLKPSADTGTLKPVFDGVKVTEIEALPPEQKKTELTPPPQTKQPAIKQQAFIDEIKMVQKEVPTEMPPVEAFNEAAVANKTTSGEMAGTMQPLLPTKTEAEAPPKAAEELPKEIVPDKQPAFPGGMQAWLAFLSRNLRSPQEMEPGEKKTALIRFHVAEDGSVTSFQVLQSAGTIFDNEVIRVLKKMPKWMPATKAGQPISVSFTQAVTFVGEEE